MASRISVPSSMTPEGATFFLAALILMFTLPCCWGFFISCRAIVLRARGQPRWIFYANPPNTVGAAVLEILTLAVCGLGLLLGLAFLWACVTTTT